MKILYWVLAAVTLLFPLRITYLELTDQRAGVIELVIFGVVLLSFIMWTAVSRQRRGTCPACGKFNPIRLKYCGHCGKAMT